MAVRSGSSLISSPSGNTAPDLATAYDRPQPRKPKRRARYRGKNPRHFHEKYKEHQPDRYPDDVAKVISGGKTPAGTHRPIMVAETPPRARAPAGRGRRRLHAGIRRSCPRPPRRRPAGRTPDRDGCRSDRAAQDRGQASRPRFPRRIDRLARLNFAALPRFLAEEAPGGADLILADLGLSSMQIDDPSRGFSFKTPGPLDMRMDPTRGRPASALLSELGESDLAQLLAENSDEPTPANSRAPSIAPMHVIVWSRPRHLPLSCPRFAAGEFPGSPRRMSSVEFSRRSGSP